MSYDGYLKWGNQEIVNAARVQAYTAASGVNVMQNKRVKADYSTIALAAGKPGGYTTPIADAAPWYDSDDPVTAEFLGVFPISVKGLTESTRTTSATEGLGDGAAPGVARASSREIVLSLGLVGNSQLAVERGLNWLKQVVNTYDEATITTFIAKPESAAAPLTKRYLYEASVLTGPLIVDERQFECYSIMQVEITMNAGQPFLFTGPSPVSTTTALPPNEVIWDKNIDNVRNIVTNPGLYSDMAGWTVASLYGAGALVTPPTTLPVMQTGMKSVRWTANSATPAGNPLIGWQVVSPYKYGLKNERYSAQVWVRSSRAVTVHLRLSMTNINGDPANNVLTHGAPTALAANVWTPVVVSNSPSPFRVTSDTQGYVSFDVINDSSMASGDIVYATAASIHVGTSPIGYFDGSTPPENGGTYNPSLGNFRWASTFQASTSIADAKPAPSIYDLLGTAVTPPPTPPQIDSSLDVDRQTWRRYYYPIPTALIPDYNDAELKFSVTFKRFGTGAGRWARSGARVTLLKNPNNLTPPNGTLIDAEIIGQIVIAKIPTLVGVNDYARLDYDGTTDSATLTIHVESGGTITETVGDAMPLLFASDGGPVVPLTITGTTPIMITLDLPLPSPASSTLDLVDPPTQFISNLQLVRKE